MATTEMGVEATRTRLERFVEGIVRVGGAHLVEWFVFGLVLWIVLFMVPAYSSLLFALLDASVGLVLRVAAVFEIAIAADVVFLVVSVLRRSRPLRSWLAGDHSEEAARAAHRWILEGVPQTFRLQFVVMSVFLVPPMLYVPHYLDMTVAARLAYPLLILLLIAGAFGFVYLLLEQALRVVIRDIIAEHDVSDTGVRGLSLNQKALVMVPLITLYAGLIIGCINTNSLDLSGRVMVLTASAGVTSLVVGGIMTLLLRQSLLDRLGHLRDALSRIGAGDYGTKLVSAFGDELDDVAKGLNDMTAQLAAHNEEMRESRARIVAAADESRKEIERNLHDGAQQYLVLMDLKLGLLRRAVEGDEKATALTTELQADLSHALAELRDLAHGLFPAVLESDGLPAALAAAGERSPLPVSVNSDGVGRLPSEIEAAVYFCCLEAMQNAAKHAGDEAVLNVTLGRVNGRLTFSVADDGVGYDSGTLGFSHGLQNMQDRIGALGGTVTIQTAPGAGTTVSGSIPARIG
jgi:signal transduction histidine kinase